MTIELFEVGGCVRDEILGKRSKDIDFSVEAPSFTAMREFLVHEGYEIFVETPQFLTIRARCPQHEVGYKGLTADFVLARKDGEYSDGRRPDEVTPGTIYDDLARRDFTMNAIAKSSDGTIIDPFDGRRDIDDRVIRCVGSARDRLLEDALRALRAVRFSITLGFFIADDVKSAIQSKEVIESLASVSVERRRDELNKAFRADSLRTFDLLAQLPASFRTACFSDGLRLESTLKGV